MRAGTCRTPLLRPRAMKWGEVASLSALPGMRKSHTLLPPSFTLSITVPPVFVACTHHPPACHPVSFGIAGWPVSSCLDVTLPCFDLDVISGCYSIVFVTLWNLLVHAVSGLKRTTWQPHALTCSCSLAVQAGAIRHERTCQVVAGSRTGPYVRHYEMCS